MNTNGTGWSVGERTSSPYNKLDLQLQSVGDKIYYVWYEDDDSYDTQIWTAVAKSADLTCVLHIKANDSEGPLSIPSGSPVSITIALDPGNAAGQNADWWIAADTSLDWYTYVYPSGWWPGINLCIQTPLFVLSPPFEVLNMTLPVGNYTFYFAIDEPDSAVTAILVDSVEVEVRVEAEKTKGWME